MMLLGNLMTFISMTSNNKDGPLLSKILPEKLRKKFKQLTIKNKREIKVLPRKKVGMIMPVIC